MQVEPPGTETAGVVRMTIPGSGLLFSLTYKERAVGPIDAASTPSAASAEGSEIETGDRERRSAIEQHWAASDANDFENEHEIYRDDAVLDYPQSGERIHGRHNIQESRTVQPSKKRFSVRRILGNGELWITELVLTYDGLPSYSVSIMKFRDGKVASETQYFCDPFKPGTSRARLVELVR